LTSSAISLGAVNLKRSLANQISHNLFGYAEPLGQLAIYAREAKASLSGGQCILAFVLEQVFRQWAYDVSDRPVQLSERTALCAAFLGPVTEAVACICDDQGNPLIIAEALIRTAAKIFPP
jgi:hypothetical protein